MQNQTIGIPPSSTMSFLKNDQTIPAIVIADHSDQYRNEYYNSIFDSFETLDINSICKASTLFANTIYKLASSNPSQNYNITVNCTLIEQIANCMSKQVSCELFDIYLPGIKFAGIDTTNYPGIFSLYNNYITTPQTKFIHDFIAQKTYSESQSCTKASDCSPNSACISSSCVSMNSTFYHFAYSTAFEMDSSWKIVDPNEPMYTESVWGSTGIRIFLKENPNVDIAILVVGIIHSIAWIVLVFFLHAYMNKKFSS